MSLKYKKVLIIGATSGIGAAFADKLVENGIFVVAVGRRKENLDNFVAKHGKDKVATAVLDILKLDQIPSFVADISKAHPDIDSILLNSGIQRGFNFAQPSAVELSIMKTESPNVKVIEVSPPAVQTEMHDAKHQPDLSNGHMIGMPVDEFVNELYARLAKGEDQIPIGTAKDMFASFEHTRQEFF
ncbi:hypothetical protein B7463_g5206, partial [Scytalidium lignicola]